MSDTSATPARLSLDQLERAVASASAFRVRTRLQGVGGDGDKLFPPTYAGGVYAVERRRIEGEVVTCALLDSVQSQANRMEEVLLEEFLPTWRELKIDQVKSAQLPILALHVDHHGWITSLTAPHRVHDAILRDSKYKNERFRDSDIGKEIVAARVEKALGLYKYCPTALLFGTWDSTGGAGLDSAKVPRAVVSEIIAVDVTAGIRTASRIDPLGIRAGSATVYRLRDREEDWTLDESQAAETDKKVKKKFGKGKPSDINHGNVTPDMPRFDAKTIRDQNLGRLSDILEDGSLELRYEISSRNGRMESQSRYRSEEVRIRPGAVKPGGVTMAYALHTWTLSLTQLRRLRFGGDETRNAAARTVLAALALYALALQQERGYWLRSRCELTPEARIELETIGGDGAASALGSAAEVRALLDAAVAEAQGIGLEWQKEIVLLTPTEKLQELVRLSDGLAPEAAEEEEPAVAGSTR